MRDGALPRLATRFAVSGTEPIVALVYRGGGRRIFLSRVVVYTANKFKRKAFNTTNILDKLIAAALNIGSSCHPNA